MAHRRRAPGAGPEARGSRVAQSGRLPAHASSGAPQGKGSDLYTIAGRIVADRACRFEDLDAELGRFGRQLGIPEPPGPSLAKPTHRADWSHYRDILSPDDRDRIECDFAFEIQTFGQAF